MSDVHSGTTGQTESLAHTVGEVSNVLLLSSEETRQRGCADLLTGSTTDADHLLGVVYGESNRFFEHLRMTAGSLPAELTVLNVHEGEPDVAFDGDSDGDGDLELTVETVHPDETGSLPTVVRERLESLDADADEVAVCFDSVSHLVDDLGVNRSFRFLNTVTTQLSQTDAVGHFHLDPDAHDEQTLSALTTTFDAVVRSSDSGGESWELVWKRLPDEDGR